MKETENPLSTLAERIRWIISENGLKQVEFAKAMGISANYVYLLTSGKKGNISDALAKLISVTYGVCAEWIIRGGAQNPNSQESDLRAQTIKKLRKMDIEELRSVAAFIRAMDE